jgi:hypothetical protein
VNEPNRAWSVGQRLRAVSDANMANWMEGLVTAYASGSVTIDVDAVGGSGTKADWTINVAGEGANLATITDASTVGFVLPDDDTLAGASATKLARSKNVKAFASNPANVTFMQAGTGASSRTVDAKLKDYAVSPQDFGAVGDGSTDDAAAFQAAIDALPAAGGTIHVPPAHYVIGTAPAEGTKNVFWDFAPGVVLSGAGTGVGKFGNMTTNTSQVAVGPYIRSQSDVASPTNGGIAAFSVEMLQPSDYVGQSVAIYAGAQGSSADAGSNVWAINALIAANTGANGTYQCIEVDVNSASTDATTKGISISGAGTADTDVGLEITRAAQKWKYGVHILNSTIGAQIDMVSGGTGVLIKSLTALPSSSAGTAIAARQSENGKDILFLQRETDTSPSGYFLRMLNAANNSNILLVDTVGNLTTVGILSGAVAKAGELRATGSRATVGAGAVSIGGAVGASAALPAGDPAGYLLINVAGTDRRVPFYT